MNNKMTRIGTVLRYLALGPIIAFGLLTIIATGGGGGVDIDWVDDNGFPTRPLGYSTPQLVDPSLRFVEVQSGAPGSVCGTTTEGSTWCWGKNGHGELGTLAPMETCFCLLEIAPCTDEPQQVDTTLQFVSLSSGSFGTDFTCGLLENGEAYCWGFGIGGQLGDGQRSDSHTPVAVTGGLRFERIRSGGSGTCGQTLTGEVYCWGGTLGLIYGNGDPFEGHITPTLANWGQTFVDFDLGELHACGITEAGEAYCWGNNWFGQVTGVLPGQTGGMGRSEVPLLVPGVSGLRSIVTGSDTSCGLDDAGQAYCWGIHTGSAAQVWPDVGPYAVDGEHVFVSLHAAFDHYCGLTADGEAYCWGSGIVGNLGNGSENHSQTPVKVQTEVRFVSLSHRPTCGLSDTGEAYCWGGNAWGELGRPPYCADPYFENP